MKLFLNESLSAISSSLDVSKHDSILAVGGNGDQPFALLEYARIVIAVDKNPEAVELMRERQFQLSNGEFYKFIGVSKSINNDSEYHHFRNKERLAKIQSKLGNLFIVQGDIFDVIEDKKLYLNELYPNKVRPNKVYLSNILSGFDKETRFEKLESIANNLPRNGLIYVSDGFDVYWGCDESRNDFEKSLGNKLVLDEQKTWVAKSLEPNRNPNVYRKATEISNKVYKALANIIPL